TIGRHGDNDIIIENLTVSGHHARVDHRDGVITLSDLNSKNGTQRNGVSITECPIEDRDLITIGKHTLRADWTDTIAVERTPELRAELAGAMNATRTMVMKSPDLRNEEPEPEAPTPRPPCPHPAGDRLAFLEGGEGTYALCKHQVSIGKNSDADIVIGGTWALLLGSPAAVITKQSGDYFLRYTGGLIRPKRNGASVKGTVKLNHDDIVEIGPVKLQIQLSQRLAA
ncbi:MAG: FHA domain-containing protein, partial [Desulfobacterales bacterium]|nr:FHA domain-containing protein [Desulfobacterales bacterium]